MGYGKPTVAVVLGGIVSYIGFALSPEWTRLELDELVLSMSTFGVLIIIGLSACIYGVFYGIELAVAAGTDREDADSALT